MLGVPLELYYGSARVIEISAKIKPQSFEDQLIVRVIAMNRCAASTWREW